MTKVTFHDQGEFIGEVNAMAQHIEGGIVRLTREYRAARSLPLKHLYVVATAVAHKPAAEGRPGARWLLRLDRYCGELLGFGDPVDPVQAKTEDLSVKICTEIDTQVRALGLVTRPGIFEEGA